MYKLMSWGALCLVGLGGMPLGAQERPITLEEARAEARTGSAAEDQDIHSRTG